MKGLVLLLAAVMPLALTAACGQKGPLYLPPRNGTVVTRPAGSQSTTPPSPAPGTDSGQPDSKKNKKDDSETPK